MSLTIFIGKNITGKTKRLKKIKELFKDPKKVFFIPSEFSLGDCLEASQKPIYSPKQAVIDFINAIHEIKPKAVDSLKKQDKILEDNYNRVFEIKNQVENNFKEDFYAEEQISNILTLNESYKLANNTDASLKPFNDIVDHNQINDFSTSGSRFYSLLKLIGESLQILPAGIDLSDFKIILDDPEKFCHPELVCKISDEIYNISKKIDVVLATHSEILSQRLFLKSTSNNETEPSDLKFKYTYFDEEIASNFYEMKKSFFESKPELQKLCQDYDKSIFHFSISNFQKVLTPSQLSSNEVKTFIKDFKSWEEKVFGVQDLNIVKALKNNPINTRQIKQLFKILFASNLILFEGLIEEEFCNYLIDKFASNKYFTLIDCSGKTSIMPMLAIIKELSLNKFLYTLIMYDQDNDVKDVSMQHSMAEVTKMIQVKDFEKYFFEFHKPSQTFFTKSGNKVNKKTISQYSIQDIIDKSTRKDVVKRLKSKEQEFERWVQYAK